MLQKIFNTMRYVFLIDQNNQSYFQKINLLKLLMAIKKYKRQKGMEQGCYNDSGKNLKKKKN